MDIPPWPEYVPKRQQPSKKKEDAMPGIIIGDAMVSVPRRGSSEAAGGKSAPAEAQAQPIEEQEEALAPINLTEEINRLVEYREMVRDSIQYYGSAEKMGPLVAAYSQALEQEIAMRDRLENPSNGKKVKKTIGKLRKLK